MLKARNSLADHKGDGLAIGAHVMATQETQNIQNEGCTDIIVHLYVLSKCWTPAHVHVRALGRKIIMSKRFERWHRLNGELGLG